MSDCDKQKQASFGAVTVWGVPDGSVFLYESGMAIDADGAPNAYSPDDTGIDALSNAGEPGNWYGLATDADGTPYVQDDSDPFPGFYVSTTSLEDSSKDAWHPGRYVDAVAIPYIVLPVGVEEALPGVELGDFAMVLNRANGARSAAIFADKGPRNHAGEGSVALADALGIRSSPLDGGADDGILYLVFAGSGNQMPRSLDEIISGAETAFQVFGGADAVDACLPAPG